MEGKLHQQNLQGSYVCTSVNEKSKKGYQVLEKYN